MKTRICPLAKPELKPLEQLTAEEARNSVKAFGDLPYSPADAKLAAELSELISKHAALGFGEVRFGYAIPDKMDETLKSRGFKIYPRWTAFVQTKHISGKPIREHSFLFNGCTFISTWIQWDDTLPEPPFESNTFSSESEAYKHAEVLAEQKLIQSKQEHEDFLSKLDACCGPESHNKNQAAASGCFSLIIAGGILIGSINWIF